MQLTIQQELYLYPEIDSKIKRLAGDINRYRQLQDELRDPMQAQKLSDMPRGCGGTSDCMSTVSKIVDYYDKRISKAEDEIMELERVKESVEAYLDTLMYEERELVRLVFFEQRRDCYITSKMHYHRQTISRKKEELYRKIGAK
jgi:hypothetical protein